jgi:hypothetical protein
MLENSLATRGTAATRPSTARQGAARPVNARSVATNRPRKQVLSGNTLEGRRLLDLADAYAAALGGWPALSELQAARVRRAAELVVIAEHARRDALLGKFSDPALLVKLENVAARAVRSLGVPEQGPQKRANGLRPLKVLA